jgi:predicted RND superfamily exporter protein
MIESIGDFLSLAVTVFFVIISLYFLYQVNVQHHAASMKKLEEQYYRYYDDADDDEEDDEDSEGPYYEE